jgi:hypothetical protein
MVRVVSTPKSRSVPFRRNQRLREERQADFGAAHPKIPVAVLSALGVFAVQSDRYKPI